MSKTLPVAASIAAVALACIASTMGASGQVVEHDKVVEDPYLDYKKYNKEIAANEAAERARQAAALASQAQSAGQDEASFQASLASVAQALNAGAPDPNVVAAPETTSPAPHTGLSPTAVIALVVIAIVAALCGGLIAWSALTRKKRRRTKPSSVSLADFARKPDDRKP